MVWVVMASSEVEVGWEGLSRRFGLFGSLSKRRTTAHPIDNAARFFGGVAIAPQIQGLAAGPGGAALSRKFSAMRLGAAKAAEEEQLPRHRGHGQCTATESNLNWRR
jgi:hypothetical protein